MNTGTLYIVATPIGNLEDITLRAIRILGEVDLIACEDTRRTSILLKHLNIQAKLTSYHEHNESHRGESLIQRLKQGQNIALVSDAGTPGIADPGFRLARACADAEITVVPLPGACAAVCALSAAGISLHDWNFLGFPPREKGKRRKFLLQYLKAENTLVLYEAPHRLIALLKEIHETMGPERRICVARELTKKFEEFVQGPSADVLDNFRARDRIRGECVVLIEGVTNEEPSDEIPPQAIALIQVLRSQDCTDRTIRDALVAAFEIKKKRAYQLLLEEE